MVKHGLSGIFLFFLNLLAMYLFECFKRHTDKDGELNGESYDLETQE